MVGIDGVRGDGEDSGCTADHGDGERQRWGKLFHRGSSIGSLGSKDGRSDNGGDGGYRSCSGLKVTRNVGCDLAFCV